MKKSKLYAVCFTVALSCVSAAMLTFANTQWKDIIEANENFDRIRSVVRVLGLFNENLDQSQIVETYNQAVTVEVKGKMTVYEGRMNDEMLGYALDILSPGKYDVIKGILSIDPSSKKILKLHVYQQNETPGLGGLVASPKWLSQFDNKPLITNGSPGLILSPDEGPNVIHAISQASKTSRLFIDSINKAITQFLSDGADLEELDLDIGPDAVSQASQGYPKHIVEPPHMRKRGRRPLFMVPPGLTNLALGKPVTSGMKYEPSSGELSQITDGLKKCEEFDFVEMDSDLQWLQIDLQKVSSIHAVAIWHFYKNPIIYNDVIVQVADDAEFSESSNVRTLFNNDHDDSSGLGLGKGKDSAFWSRWWGEIVDARGSDYTGTKAQFVRVYTSNGVAKEEIKFVEIAVYGE